MTRALVLGDALITPASLLGLDLVADGPEIILVDLSDEAAVTSAAGIHPMVPRLAVAGTVQAAFIQALGRGGFELVTRAEPAAMGPLIARLAPRPARSATRLVVVTGVAGGCGRTLLAVNLALRLATRGSVALVDLTGSGSASWWLRVAAAPWAEIEGVASELTPEHLAVVASERGRVRVIGGAGSVPSAELGLATTRASLGLADIVVVDGPPLLDERTRVIVGLADRVLVVATDDPWSAAQLAAASRDHWFIASRCEREEIASHGVMRSLPDDPVAVRSAAQGDGTVGGRLGRAYDDLAELLAIDATQ